MMKKPVNPCLKPSRDAWRKLAHSEALNVFAPAKEIPRFAQFIRDAWHVLEPSTKLDDNWHIDAVADHLQALFEDWLARKKDESFVQRFQNLIINIPPGTAKSRISNVMFPAWVWLRFPSFRWIFLSANPRVSLRDSVLCRELIESRWYRDTFKPTWQLRDDQNAKGAYWNTAGGVRSALGFFARMTGDRADAIVWDDPHDAEEVNSDVQREAVTERWDTTIGNRVNDLRMSLRIGIMQRLHEADLSGHVLAKGGWEHLVLEMEKELEPVCKCESCKRQKEVGHSIIGWSDPRTKEGELLFPTRFPENRLEEERARLGVAGYAGQMQQRPAPKGGLMFKRHWFLPVPMPAADFFVSLVRYWDKAGTQGGGAYTVGALVGKGQDGLFYLVDIVRAQVEAGPRKALIKQTAQLDAATYGTVVIWQEQEPGSGGKEQAETQKLELAGYLIFTDKVSGDKQTRAVPLAAQAYGGNTFGNFRICVAPWNEEWLKEAEMFPKGKYKDQIDATAGAFLKLTLPQEEEDRKPAYNPADALAGMVRSNAPPRPAQRSRYQY